MGFKKTEKKLILISTNDLSLKVANKVKASIAKKNIEAVIIDQTPRYVHFAKIAEENPDYTLTLNISQGTKLDVTVLPYRVEHCTGKPQRDTTNAHVAAKRLNQALQMVDRIPTTRVGSSELNYDFVRDFKWFVDSVSPFLIVRSYCTENEVDELASAIEHGIAAYFRR